MPVDLPPRRGRTIDPARDGAHSALPGAGIVIAVIVACVVTTLVLVRLVV
jgi:hypothetical protein